MDILVDFLLNNYIWFLVISLILIFALIGYLVDSTSPRVMNKKNSSSLVQESNDNRKVETHPSLEVYTNEVFDDPLINEKTEQ